ncbi:MAG TPA: hypothetical protein VMW81_01785 [Nitrospinota bacterium]|nr:hypothetical protein [Nitrospinota bacterium]
MRLLKGRGIKVGKQINSLLSKQKYGVKSDEKLSKKPSFQNRPSLSKRKD